MQERRRIHNEKDVRKEATATVPWAYFPYVRERECQAFLLVSYPPPRMSWPRHAHASGENAAPRRAASKPLFVSRAVVAQVRFDPTFAHFRIFIRTDSYSRLAKNNVASSGVWVRPINCWNNGWQNDIATLLSRVDCFTNSFISLTFLTRLRNSFLSTKSIGQIKRRRNKVAAFFPDCCNGTARSLQGCILHIGCTLRECRNLSTKFELSTMGSQWMRVI